MEVVIPNVGNNPAAIAQPEVALAVNMPLQGINFLLDIVGFHIPAEHECLIKAGLADYENFCYLIEKDLQDMAEEFSKWTLAQDVLLSVLVASNILWVSCIGSKIVFMLVTIPTVLPLMKKL